MYPSVNVSGMVHIGACVELGTGTQIIQGLNVVSNAVIGAGAVVVRDIRAAGTYGGACQGAVTIVGASRGLGRLNADDIAGLNGYGYGYIASSFIIATNDESKDGTALRNKHIHELSERRAA